MSKNRQKTRFTAHVNGEEKLLFSVRENQNGSLTIVFTHHDILHPGDTPTTFADGDYFESQHYSIHPTLRSNPPSINIHHTLKPVGKPATSTSTLVQNTESYFVWPVFARQVMDLTNSKYDFEERSKDIIVNIGSYNSFNATLIYMVVVSYADYDPKHAGGIPFLSKSAIFRRFRLTTYYAYFHLPSPPQGWILHPMTSEPIAQGETQKFETQIYTESPSPDELLDAFQIFSNEISATLRSQCANAMNLLAIPPEIEWRFSTVFSEPPPNILAHR